ncbi:MULTISPECIES: sulfite oxidase [Bacillaceae]|uniref:Sulfite oxidase n=1 Tax=Evansella alkalicola TaxID=745819 RepID=A0ABS6JTW9_9BACI|nr:MULTISPECIES: sulfite oxidase [Bacillaceae]MBU9722033.1 sulfite oxidase [Bacillus alkalicola]
MNDKNRLFRTTRSTDPEVQESPIHFLKSLSTSENLFFIRNHFPYPTLNSKISLRIYGEVYKPLVFHFEHFKQMKSKSLKVMLECAGNKRSKFEPRVYGEQWENGAISQGTWRGITLNELFKYTGIKSNVQEVVFEGYDFGERPDGKHASFIRSLPISKALHSDTIIAYEYNGSPLSFKRGGPLRLIVPQWYAMASVKWLKNIYLVEKPFSGPFQTDDYVYYPNKTNKDNAFPVTTVNVNTTIQQPLNFSKLGVGEHEIKGISWSGKGKIVEVAVSINDSEWISADLKKNSQGYTWTPWSYKWKVKHKGHYSIRAKATDSTGSTQPFRAYWNQKGYGYNAIDTIYINIE